MKLGTYILEVWEQLFGSRILNFGPCAMRGHLELSLVGRDNAPRARCLFHWNCRKTWCEWTEKKMMLVSKVKVNLDAC